MIHLRNLPYTAAAVLTAVLVARMPLPAQRSWDAEFDDKKPTKITGVVTKWEWNNPEVFAFVDVTDKGGAITNWAVEFADTLDLKNISNGIDLFHVETGNWPDGLQQLQPKYLKELHKDPWGSESFRKTGSEVARRPSAARA